MFRIRRIFDDTLHINHDALVQIRTIIRNQFPFVRERDIAELPKQLHDPLKYRFRPILYVAENAQHVVNGFALMLHAPDLQFCFLDYLSVASGKSGRGLGGILYEQVRQEASSFGVIGLFLECLPDDPVLSPDATIRKQNEARLKFYERYGARPIANTRYETPLDEHDTDPPYLVFDDLGSGKALRRKRGCEIIEAVLERKYKHLCPPEYVRMVVESVTDDPVRLRDPRYIKVPSVVTVQSGIPSGKRIALFQNRDHGIHHVHDRGYVESPVRIARILEGIEPTGLFSPSTAKQYPERYISDVHDRGYLNYFRRVCRSTTPERTVYPYVFPIRNKTLPPKDLSVRAGYYCIDTFTPLNEHAYKAAKSAVHCALSGADALLEGIRVAYALVRPPGHHAEKSYFGGFCYFNSTAVAAQYLSRHGRIAILDIDYHHGNGQQDIFYERNDVLTVSIHGHPNVAYPYFSGFRNERGSGPGTGYNLNFPLPEAIDGERYCDCLTRALVQVRRFTPDFLLVAFGLDTAKNDPTGSWLLQAKDFQRIGDMIGALHCKTLIVQEGGYDSRVIGTNARNFFQGFWKSCFAE